MFLLLFGICSCLALLIILESIFFILRMIFVYMYMFLVLISAYVPISWWFDFIPLFLILKYMTFPNHILIRLPLSRRLWRTPYWTKKTPHLFHPFLYSLTLRLSHLRLIPLSWSPGVAPPRYHQISCLSLSSLGINSQIVIFDSHPLSHFSLEICVSLLLARKFTFWFLLISF